MQSPYFDYRFIIEKAKDLKRSHPFSQDEIPQFTASWASQRFAKRFRDKISDHLKPVKWGITKVCEDLNELITQKKLLLRWKKVEAVAKVRAEIRGMNELTPARRYLGTKNIPFQRFAFSYNWFLKFKQGRSKMKQTKLDSCLMKRKRLKRTVYSNNQVLSIKTAVLYQRMPGQKRLHQETKKESASEFDDELRYELNEMLNESETLSRVDFNKKWGDERMLVSKTPKKIPLNELRQRPSGMRKPGTESA